MVIPATFTRPILYTRLLEKKKSNEVTHGAELVRRANRCLSSLQVLCILWDQNVMGGIVRSRQCFLL